MCTKSRWSTSSRRIPCCTSMQSHWPLSCGCGNSWNHSEPICSAAGQQWRRTCAAGKSQTPAHSGLFFLSARDGGQTSFGTFPRQPTPGLSVSLYHLLPLTHFTFSWEHLSQLIQAKTNITSQPSSRLWIYEWVPRAGKTFPARMLM